jgi:hypothetical protein
LREVIAQKEEMLFKKTETMNKVMYSKYMNEWKRKAFVKKSTAQDLTPDGRFYLSIYLETNI